MPFAAAVVDDEATVGREPERDGVERFALAVDEDAVARAGESGPRLPGLRDRRRIGEQRQCAIEGADERGTIRGGRSRRGENRGDQERNSY